MYGDKESLYTEKENSAEQYPAIEYDLIYQLAKFCHLSWETKTNDRLFWVDKFKLSRQRGTRPWIEGFGEFGTRRTQPSVLRTPSKLQTALFSSHSPRWTKAFGLQKPLQSTKDQIQCSNFYDLVSGWTNTRWVEVRILIVSVVNGNLSTSNWDESSWWITVGHS